MITDIILFCCGFLVILLVLKFFTGKSKPSENRSGLEKIACSLFSIFRKNTEDIADSIRTPKVLKEEAMQEITDALNSLEKSFKDGQINLKTAKNNLEKNILPDLENQPGILKTKAIKAKQDYEKSVKEGSPIEAYKSNAIKFLSYRAKAYSNIERTKKNIQKLDIAIKTAKADYDGQRVDLEMIKNDLLAMTEIERYDLNQSITRIKSLQNELCTKMDRAAIEREVESEFNNDSENYDSEAAAEFDSL